MSDNIKGFISDIKGLKSMKVRWGGYFGKKDPVHFDSPVDKKTWNKLYKDNQTQFQSGSKMNEIHIGGKK